MTQDELEKLAEKLWDIHQCNSYSNEDIEWKEMDDDIGYKIIYRAISKYVVKLILEARIDELMLNATSDVHQQRLIIKRFEELQSQLTKLNKGDKI